MAFSGGHILPVGATSCHVVFSGGHISPCGFEWGPHLAMWFLVGATSCHVVFNGGHILECQSCAPPGSSAVPARVARQALFASTRTPVPARSLAGPARVARRPRQGQVAHHPTVYRLDRPCLSSGVRCRPSPGVRGPRQGRPPSPPGWPAKLVLGMWVLVGATSWNVENNGGHILPCGF